MEQRYTIMANTLTLTQVAIQESPKLRAVNADKGITKELLQSDRVLLGDDIHTAVRGKIAEALADYVDQICDRDTYPDVSEKELDATDFDHIRAGIMANINLIKIDAGTGFTSTHKANLIGMELDTPDENGEVQLILAIDFVCPSKRGESATVAKSAKSGTMSL
jgi:hypothetical protein